DLIRYRLRNERSIERIADQPVQTDLGEFRLCAFEDRVNGSIHLALARGPLDGPEPPLVRVHIADTLRDLLGVRGDGRQWTLRAALERIAEAESGVVVILRTQDSSEDVAEALRALAVPDASGRSSVLASDGPVLRTYGIGAQILKDLGVRRMRVLSAP